MFGLTMHAHVVQRAAPEPPFAAFQRPALSPCCCWCGCAPPLCAHGCCVAPSADALCPLSGMARAYISTGHSAWKTILCSVTERCQIIDFPNGHRPQIKPVAETPLATCGTVEEQAAVVSPSPKLLSLLCPGLHALLSATAGRSDEPALLSTGLAYIHRGEPVQGGRWSRGLRACRQQLLGLPEHTGQQLRGKVTPLLCGSWGCWCSCGSCDVRDDTGTATLALALAAGSRNDHKCKINQERPQCWGSAVALQKEAGCGRGN